MTRVHLVLAIALALPGCLAGRAGCGEALDDRAQAACNKACDECVKVRLDCTRHVLCDEPSDACDACTRCSAHTEAPPR